MNKKEIKIKKIIKLHYENQTISSVYFIPLLLIASFVPLIVYAKNVYLLDTTQALYWTGQQQHLDFFSFWKSRWLIILTVIELVIYIMLFRFRKLPFKNLKYYYIPLGIYALFVIISTLFPIDTQTALWGFVDMYQGVFVLLCYVLIIFLTINFVNSEMDVKLFVKAFLILMIVEGIIGTGQYFGFDFFQTKLGNDLILPNYLKIDNLSFPFGPKTIYGTLFNTNFVGSFAALMLPLSVAFLLSAKLVRHRIVSCIAVILMIFVWLGCNSRAGYLGVSISAIFGLWLFRKLVVKHWKVSISFVVVIIVATIGFNTISDGALFARLKTLDIREKITSNKSENEDLVEFKDISLGKDTFSISTNKETLNFKIDKEKIYFMDESNSELKITTVGNQITINDPKYAKYKITVQDNYPGISVMAYGKAINFYISNEGVKIIGSGGRLTEPKASPFFEPLRGLETIGSNRGYEWGATIPMLKNYIFIGAGPDNFPIAFNQDDFVAKLNLNSFDANIVIDKPHNAYLQTGINTGVVSLIALLAVYGIYVVSSLMLYSKINFNNLEEILGGACLISVIGYLTTGFFNDNVVSVAPLFCIILGLGIAINEIIKNKMSANEIGK